MAAVALKRKNHYVPKMLLKQFCLPTEDLLWEYRLLVPDKRIPAWEQRSPSLLAKTTDLYVIADGVEESDAIETWLDLNFENSARDALVTAAAGKRLKRERWRSLIRLYAAQFVRTPHYYLTHKDRWFAEVKHEMELTQARLLAQLPRMQDFRGNELIISEPGHFPVRYVLRKEGEFKRTLTIQTVTGRKHWMYAIQHALRPHGPVTMLERYKWTMLAAPAGLPWFLTDNPALCVNERPNGSRTFDGGWNQFGSQLGRVNTI